MPRRLRYHPRERRILESPSTDGQLRTGNVHSHTGICTNRDMKHKTGRYEEGMAAERGNGETGV